MSQNPIVVRIPENTLNQEAERLLKSADWRPMMATIAELVHGEIRDNIREGGRPAKFAPLSPLYKAQKVSEGYNPLPLRRTLALFNSLHVSHTDTEAVVGTNVIYAAIHHYGGMIKPKSGKALSFTVGRKNLVKKSITLPARPYRLLTENGEDEIAAIIDSRVHKLLGLR